MSRLDNIGIKIGRAAEITVNKVKEISEIAKLNSYISAEEKNIEEAYIEIGKLIYEQIKDQATGNLGELCETIKKSNGKIEKYKAKIEQVKNS